MESWTHLLRLFAHLNPQSSDFGYICALSSPFLVVACVPMFVCVARKLWPCLSYSRRRDRIDLGLLRSLDKRGGEVTLAKIRSGHFWYTNFCVPDPPTPPFYYITGPQLPNLCLGPPVTAEGWWAAGSGEGARCFLGTTGP